MSSPNRTTTPINSLAAQLQQIGMCAIPAGLDDFLARATKACWSPRQVLEQLGQIEADERSRRAWSGACGYRASRASSPWPTSIGLARQDRARRDRARRD